MVKKKKNISQKFKIFFPELNTNHMEQHKKCCVVCKTSNMIQNKQLCYTITTCAILNSVNCVSNKPQNFETLSLNT